MTMSKCTKRSVTISDINTVEVKSKFDAEYRRFSISRAKPGLFDEFYCLLERLHKLQDIFFIVTYTDCDGDQLPINNDDNLHVAVTNSHRILRLLLQRKGESVLEFSGYGNNTLHQRNSKLAKIIRQTAEAAHCTTESSRVTISLPENFQHVSAVIDVHIIPTTQRRVRLMKAPNDRRPLGFYIRDGLGSRVTPHGVEQVPGIFISRLVTGGLADSTGLLAVNDEVLEVNGIEVVDKTLDQVTDMMVANGNNLVITIRPFNQRNNIVPRRRMVADVTGSWRPEEAMGREEEEDEICDHSPLPVNVVNGGRKLAPLIRPAVSIRSGEWVMRT